MRKVKTGWGATAVQIVEKCRGVHRIAEQASQRATIAILNELGVRAPHRNTLSAALTRATAHEVGTCKVQTRPRAWTGH